MKFCLHFFVFFDGLHDTVNERSHVDSVEIDLGLFRKFYRCLGRQAKCRALSKARD